MKQRQKRKHLENEESLGTAEQGGGVSKSQEDAPQVESTEEAKGWAAGVEEVSSASEYFSCVSSPLELIHSGLRRVHRDSPQPRSPLAQVQERGETAPPSHHVSSSPSSYKTCVSSLYINKKERGMKIYYMQVQMRKGVAVSWETEETSESVEKQPRLEEVTLPEDVRVGTPPSDVSTRNLLSDSEPSGEEREQEERAESDSPPGAPAVEDRPRAKTPDWLVTVEAGFRCMACCRVFSTLESLQEHVQHGVREGFSCHVFHLAVARLGGGRRAGSAQEEEGEPSEAAAARPEGKAREEEPAAPEDLGSKRPWSRCPGCGFHSPKDKNN